MQEPANMPVLRTRHVSEMKHESMVFQFHSIYITSLLATAPVQEVSGGTERTEIWQPLPMPWPPMSSPPAEDVAAAGAPLVLVACIP